MIPSCISVNVVFAALVMESAKKYLLCYFKYGILIPFFHFRILWVSLVKWWY